MYVICCSDTNLISNNTTLSKFSCAYPFLFYQVCLSQHFASHFFWILDTKLNKRFNLVVLQTLSLYVII